MPIPNLDPDFRSFEDLKNEEIKKNLTINEKTWQILNINEETPYDIYEL